MKDVFLLVKDPENDCRDMIFHQGSHLKMRVYCLSEHEYVPNPEELQFYGDNHGELFAFETFQYDMDEPGLVIEAIRWYARYIGNTDMEILAEDPRSGTFR